MSERAGNPSVLVVDDDLYVPSFLSMVLEEMGLEVAVAHDGFEALKLFSHRAFALVITDQAMPGIRGLELALELRARRPGQKIFLLTGYAEEFRWKAQSLVDRVLMKPIAPNELMEAVMQAIPEAAGPGVPALIRE